jgi:hypothetical protein
VLRQQGFAVLDATSLCALSGCSLPALRLFEPMTAELLAQPVWPQLLLWLAAVCSGLKGRQPWFVEAHQFRIDTTDGIGRPTPEVRTAMVSTWWRCFW